MANAWNVDLVERTHDRTCWSACVAMLLNHRDSTSLTDGDVAHASGAEDHGSVASDDAYGTILDHYLLTVQHRYAPSPREWDEVLAPGPVIAAYQGNVVVISAAGDVDDARDCQLYVLDPVYGGAWVAYGELGDRFGFHPGTELLIVQP